MSTKWFPDGSVLHLLNYVDDKLYYGTDATKVQAFEKELGDPFNLELLGNALWYLGSRKNLRQHDTPLPSGFMPTCDDCAAADEESQELSTAFNLDFVSCIGSLIYLNMT